MNSFIKTTTETFTPLWVRKDFSTYSKTFKNIREGMDYTCRSCFKCEHKFELDEKISIACFKEIGNKILCLTCAEDIS